MSSVATSSNNAATSGAEQYFNGFELLYKTIEKSVEQKMDVVIALVHFMLIRHANFRCVGLISDAIDESNNGSELLPDNWNCNEKKYDLRYRRDKDYFKLMSHQSEETYVINLMNNQTNKVSNLVVNPNTLVKDTKGNLLNMIPEARHFADRIRTELLSAAVLPTATASVTTQTITPEQRHADPLRISDSFRPRGQFPTAIHDPFRIPDVGRGDLDPLGRGGPGNLFPFPTHPDLRMPGAAPRFDPFAPPERSIRPNPNPDHLQPPNFGGDQFYM